MQNYVIYHKGCTDGVMGAAIAKRFLPEDTIFIPGEYGTDPEEIKASKIYFIDFCYKNNVMQKLFEAGNTLVILDHHLSQINDNLSLLNLDEVIDRTSKDNSKSGTGLAYEYFVGNGDLPVFLKQIQDRDLWTWSDPLSAPLMAWFNLIPITIEDYSEILDIILTEGFSPSEIDNIVTTGKAILKSKQMSQKSIVDSGVRFLNILGWENIPCINCSWNDMSDIGGYLNDTYNPSFSLMWCLTDKGLKIGLRSSPDKSKEDVSIVAQLIHSKGGGHYSSAGATVPYSELHSNEIMSILVRG